MIVERIRAEFKRRLNKLDSNHYKDYPIPFIDDLFNLKQVEFIDLVIGAKPIKMYKEGIEETTVTIDLISNLLEKDKKLNPYISTQEYVEFILPDNYSHYARLSVNTDCGVFYNTQYVKQGNFNDFITDSNNGPSKIWKRTVYNIAKTSDKESSSLYCYKKDFTINSVNLSYYKKPNNVFSGGYDTLDFTVGDLKALSQFSPKVDSNLLDKAANYVIDMMVYEVQQNQGNQVGYQMSQQKLNLNQ